MVQFDLNAHRTTPELLSAVDNVGYTYGHTNAAEAIRVAREMFT